MMNIDSNLSQDHAMPIIRSYWARFIEIGLASLIINLFGLFTPLYSMLLYDKVIGNNISETLWGLTIGMVIVVMIDFVLRLIRAYYIEQIAYRSDLSLDRGVVDKLLKQNTGIIYSSGELLSKYRDLSATRDILSSSYMLAVADLPFMLLYVILLAIIGGPVVAGVIVVGALLIAFNLFIKRPTSHYNGVAQRCEAARLGLLAEITTHADLIRVSTLSGYFMNRWQAIAEASSSARSRSRFWQAISYSSISDGALLMWIVTLVIGVLFTENNTLTIGGLSACSLLAGRIGGGIGSFILLLGRYDIFKKADKEFSAIFSDQDAPSQPFLPPRALSGQMTVKQLYFRFPQAPALALENVQFSFNLGEKIGLVGSNGSGKSTLLRCMAGILKAQDGSVSVDGADILAFDPAWRAQWLSYKPQDPLLFDASLEGNIRGDATDFNVQNMHVALQVSGVADAIAGGEMSLDKRILTGGANLSGGQRQTVALARSLVSSPILMLLDEPTAGIDPTSEAKVVARLMDYCAGRSLVVATHSMHLLGKMDRIIVLDHGRIVADGPRDQVILA